MSKEKSKEGNRAILNHATLSVWAATLILCCVLVFGLHQIRGRVQGIQNTLDQVWQENKLLLEGLDELLVRTQQPGRNAETEPPAAETPDKNDQEKVGRNEEDGSSRKYKIYYRTKDGEDLAQVSEKFEVSEDQLRLWNALKTTDPIIPGQVLVINKSTQPEKPADAAQAASPPDDRGVTKREEPDEAEPPPESLVSARPPQNETKRDEPATGETSVDEPGPAGGTGDALAARGEEPMPEVPENVVDEPVDETVHVVRQGESLSAIGQTYGVSWLALATLNGIEPPGTIYVGQRLRIPEDSEMNDSEPEDSEMEDSEPGDSEMNEASLPTSEVTHKVQPGENLYRIGLAYDLSWEQIARANGITHPTQIYVGQILKIPTARGGPE